MLNSKQVSCYAGPVLAQAHCRISPPRFLAECRMRRLNQGTDCISYCLLCLGCDVFSFCSVCFDLSSVLYFTASTDVNGTA